MGKWRVFAFGRMRVSVTNLPTFSEVVFFTFYFQYISILFKNGLLKISA